MRRPSRLALRIYLIGVAQLGAILLALWLTGPRPPESMRPPPDGDFDARGGPPPLRRLRGPPQPSAGLAAKLLLLPLVLAGISAIVTAAWLGGALTRLSEAARALGAGKLSTRTGLRRNDELGDVAIAFDEMAARLEQLVRSQRELLANVSHELRTPLSRIRVALDLAEEGGAVVAAESLGGIAGDLAEVERLVEDILTSARLELSEGAATPLRVARMGAAALLDDATTRFRSQHPGRELTLSPGAPGAQLDADRMLLRRALDNLLDNAARHSGAQAPILLSARREEREAGPQLVIEVRDTGRGMSVDEQRQLFTPFFRADPSRTRQTGGLGLGLVLARRIVEAHRGTLDVESAPARGTCARIAVPLAAPGPESPGGAADRVASEG